MGPAATGGDSRYQKDRFDYDYTNIFRSTQDLDLVVDGSEAQAMALEKLLAKKFPYFEGGKSSWEVRLLHENMGQKTSLLDNDEFLNQHSDSHSTGLIEVTDHEGPFVRDLRDWNSSRPNFLKDVLAGRLTYYYSKKHFETKMAQDGDNPEIFSVLRFLTKAIQYELAIDKSDLLNIRNVIKAFDPHRDLSTSYSAARIRKLGISMIRHSVDMEYAAEQISSLNLKDKLLQIGNLKTNQSMAWWVNKQPLTRSDIGTGNGKTANDLGLDIVAHETINFEAYESITRAHTGDPNVFISREAVDGEVAAFGNGFYTRIGFSGARGTGFTIRFKISPAARENTDFIIHGDYVIILNKSAIQVIPDSLPPSLLGFFDLLVSGKLDFNEKAQFEKFKRKFKVAGIKNNDEKVEIMALLRRELQPANIFEFTSVGALAERVENQSILLNQWLTSSVSIELLDFTMELIKNVSGEVLNGALEELAKDISSSPWVESEKFLDALNDKKTKTASEFLLKFFLSQPKWKGREDVLDGIVGTSYGDHNKVIAEFILSKPHWSHRGDLLEKIVSHTKNLPHDSNAIAKFVFTQPFWHHREDLLRKLFVNVPNYSLYEDLAIHIFSQEQWVSLQDLVVPAFEIHPDRMLPLMLANVLSKPFWYHHKELYHMAILTFKNSRSVIDLELFFQGILNKNNILVDPKVVVEAVSQSLSETFIFFALSYLKESSLPDFKVALRSAIAISMKEYRQHRVPTIWLNLIKHWLEMVAKYLDQKSMTKLLSIYTVPHTEAFLEKIQQFKDFPNAEKIIEGLLAQGKPDMDISVLRFLLKDSGFPNRTDFVERIYRRCPRIHENAFIKLIFWAWEDDHFMDTPKIANVILKSTSWSDESKKQLVEDMLSNPDWYQHISVYTTLFKYPELTKFFLDLAYKKMGPFQPVKNSQPLDLQGFKNLVRQLQKIIPASTFEILLTDEPKYRELFSKPQKCPLENSA